MNTIQELREKRAKAWEDAKTFLDSKTDKEGRITDEDSATYEKMESDVVAMGHDIERLERQAALDAELAKPLGKPIVEKPMSGSAPEKKDGRAGDEYKRAFWDALRSKDPGRTVYDALQVSTDSEGGYLVPDEFEKTLISLLADQNIFRQIAKIVQTESGNHLIPVQASKGSAYWVAEEAAYNESDNSFGQVVLGAHKLGALMKVSEELLNDSVFNLENYIAQEYARRISDKEEESFCIGDGSGKPIGVFHDTLGAEASVTAASATAVTTDELLDLYYSLRGPYRKNAAWVMNESSLKGIRKLKDGNGQYLWQPGLTAGEPDMLFGAPVKTSIYVPAMAAGAKAIAFGDFSYYWIADRQGRSLKRLNELYAATGQVGFLGTQRVDGKQVLGEAIKCVKMKTA
jgi:HK97 family phage major capsid protein